MAMSTTNKISNNDSTTSQKSISSRESYGFITHFLCFPIGFFYLCWIIIPDETLHAMDITYYPHKSLALLIPTGISIAFITAPFIYAMLNYLSAPSYHSIDTLWDEASNVPPQDNTRNGFCDANDGNKHITELLSPSSLSCIPEIQDIDVSVINRSISRQQQHKMRKIEYNR